MTGAWSVRPEGDGDAQAVHEVNAAAFPTPAEADLVDELRRDPAAWIDGLSYVAEQDARSSGTPCSPGRPSEERRYWPSHRVRWFRHSKAPASERR